MVALDEGELRWVIGAILSSAREATSLDEFADALSQVAPPKAVLAEIGDVIISDAAQYAYAVTRTAASILYADKPIERENVFLEAEAMSRRLALLPMVGPRPKERPAPPQEPPSETVDAAPPDRVLGDQNVIVNRDVNAPIVNAPGGSVTIGDYGNELAERLHDYATFLVFVTLGVKRRNATPDVLPVVEGAVEALVDYQNRHAIFRSETAFDEARSVTGQLDDACRLVMGLSFDDARPQLFESPSPTFELFDEMVLIPGGDDPFTAKYVAPFYLSRYPVRVSEYAQFCRACSWAPVPEWEAMAPPRTQYDWPITGVSLIDAVMYCVWLEVATGFRFRLVTEPEWCFAATRGRRQRYPWGDEYMPGMATTARESPTGPRRVDACPAGRSPFGIYDLAGNVWELTATLFADSPFEEGLDFDFPPVMQVLVRPEWWLSDRRLPKGAGDWMEAARFVMRGGSWGGGPEWATMEQRIWTSMFNRGAYGGFRVACSAEELFGGLVPTPSYLSPRVAQRFNSFDIVDSEALDAFAVAARRGGCGGSMTFGESIGEALLDCAVRRYSRAGDAVRTSGDRSTPRAWLRRVAGQGSGFPKLRN